MKHTRIKYMSAFSILFVSSVFRVLLLVVSYFTVVALNEELEPAKRIPISKVINAVQIMPAVLLMVEAILYLAFRKRFFLKKFVRWHLWMTIVSSVLFPIIQFIVQAFIIPTIYSASEIEGLIKRYEGPTLFFGWVFFAIARLFFIITMVKSVTSLKEPEQTDESTGFLNEFTR